MWKCTRGLNNLRVSIDYVVSDLAVCLWPGDSFERAHNCICHIKWSTRLLLFFFTHNSPPLTLNHYRHMIEYEQEMKVLVKNPERQQ